MVCLCPSAMIAIYGIKLEFVQCQGMRDFTVAVGAATVSTINRTFVLVLAE